MPSRVGETNEQLGVMGDDEINRTADLLTATATIDDELRRLQEERVLGGVLGLRYRLELGVELGGNSQCHRHTTMVSPTVPPLAVDSAGD